MKMSMVEAWTLLGKVAPVSFYYSSWEGGGVVGERCLSELFPCMRTACNTGRGMHVSPWTSVAVVLPAFSCWRHSNQAHSSRELV